ncbi:hypothetical protein RJ639_043504, partial [Escallonia herrerae]
MSTLTCTKLTLYTMAAVVVQITGLLLFLLGFFPSKPALSGFSGAESFRPPEFPPVDDRNATILFPDQLISSKSVSTMQDLSGIPPSFDRLILMVIDGLPAEFVLGKDGQPPPKAFMDAMPYTQSLLANKKATGYHAKAAPPTVTMPRLKAMVSGSIGGFLDVAFNFNTQALLDDNLIAQFLRIGWKMVMLGDETWLKLFPGVFTRHDGVNSFFVKLINHAMIKKFSDCHTLREGSPATGCHTSPVKDTVLVDQNVSRHLADELDRTDWNLLILHYLGVDHVGHIGGRKSILMGPKLSEMDEVVKMIHLRTIQTQKSDEGRTLLLVVSDHGMTEYGNHGGSSHEETDSLALFIGLRNHDNESVTTNSKIKQVDIAPTLALHYGVPIPKNNAGVLIVETFTSLTDEQQLRALELNSWQLLRLLHAQLPDLARGGFLCDAVSDSNQSGTSVCKSNMEEMFCCLYLDAVALHKSWRLKKGFRLNSKDDYTITMSAYHEFLTTASEWLSHRATDKPFGLLASGVMALFLSCLVLLGLAFLLGKEVHLREKHHHSEVSSDMKWHLEEKFSLAFIMVLVLSMGSSSLVEEEQYIWHFLTSTFYLVLLRKSIQLKHNTFSLSNGKNKRNCIQLCSIVAVLISGRVLRGWHQGGVNWIQLPDISKWLEKAGSSQIKYIQLASGLLVICLSFCTLSLLWPKRKRLVVVVWFIYLLPASLVLLYIIKNHDSGFEASGDGSTLLAQIIYGILGTSTLGIVFILPWLLPVRNSKPCSNSDSCLSSDPSSEILLLGIKDSSYVIGWGYMFGWCLLQLLLQQPINSTPILLLLVQILASISCFCHSDLHLKQWVEVAGLYYLGMAGHFSLGNTNTLATIDVAGAYIGVSSHSTLLSGILMFIITYASPMLALLSIVVYISLKGTRSPVYSQNLDSGHLLKMTLGFPCLVPLSLNSIILIAYTIVLLLMRNHLFVWSVFSPKRDIKGAKQGMSSRPNAGYPMVFPLATSIMSELTMSMLTQRAIAPRNAAISDEEAAFRLLHKAKGKSFLLIVTNGGIEQCFEM